MSAGDFVNSKYESDTGGIYAIRVQPETLALSVGGTTNNAPTGAVDQEGRARTSGGNRKYGIKARFVTLRSPESGGTLPAGYKPGQLLRVPILTPALFNAIPPSGGEATYLGTTMEVVGKGPQRGR